MDTNATMETKFKCIGIGIVTKDKPEDSVWVEVHPVENMPSMEGDYNQPDKLKYQGEDSQARHVSFNIDRSKTITCRWIDLYNSNRGSAPDVVIGEKVHLWQMAGEDIYYWTSIGIEMRKLEKVLYMYANKRESKPNDDNGEEAYYFLVDTRNKELVLHTANNDGEKSLYDFILNTLEGEFTIRDLQGNYVHLESTLVNGRLSFNVNDKVQGTTTHTVLESKETITTTTKSEVKNNETSVTNTSQSYVINTPAYNVYSNGDNLIDIFVDWLKYNQGEVHICPHGSTHMSGGSVAQHQAIIDRLLKLKAGENKNTGLKFDPPPEGR